MNPLSSAFPIREAVEEDFEQLVSLMHEFAHFQKTPGRMKMTAEKLRSDKGWFQFLLAATDNNKIAGYVCFFPSYYSWTGKAIYIDDLYVKEEYRGRGIGKQLLNKVVEKARQEACVKVRWQVSRWNENAIRFYRSSGATTDETELNCDLIL